MISDLVDDLKKILKFFFKKILTEMYKKVIMNS